MLKKRMRQEEEERRGIKIRIHKSSVFSNTAVETMNKFCRECFTYKSLPDAPSDVDQPDWWRSHREQFPLLSFLLRVVFAVPVASSKSEHVISVAGKIVTPMWANLDTDKVEELVIVKNNLSILRELDFRK